MSTNSKFLLMNAIQNFNKSIDSLLTSENKITCVLATKSQGENSRLFAKYLNLSRAAVLDFLWLSFVLKLEDLGTRMNWWFMFAVFVVIMIFLRSDGQFWNKTPRREFVFWSVIIIAISGNVLYEPVSRMFPGVGWAPVLATVVCSLPLIWKTEKNLRNRLTKFKEVSPAALIGGILRKNYSFLDVANAQVDEDKQLLGAMLQSTSVLNSSLREIGGYAEHSRKKVIDTEKWIIEQFSTMSARNLNRVLAGINLAVLIKDMRDHTTGKNPPKHKTM
jgi:hypothetical protein